MLCPQVEPVRCTCWRLFHVFVGVDEEGERVSRRLALDLGAVFVVARLEPFVTCSCGRLLDFALDGSELVM